MIDEGCIRRSEGMKNPRVLKERVHGTERGAQNNANVETHITYILRIPVWKVNYQRFRSPPMATPKGITQRKSHSSQIGKPSR